MEAQAPVVATVNYQLQPVICFTGKNWSIFHAAFVNYARQQGFYTILGEEGVNEPNENADRWRQRMAQATTAITSGWVSQNILAAFRHENDDNANTIWRRLTAHYANVTDIRQLSLRDRAERYRQRDNETMMDFLGHLNMRVADLAASGQQCDSTYRKQLVRNNCNSRFRPLITQILLINPNQSYEDFTLALLEAAADSEEYVHSHNNNDRAYFSNSNRSRGYRGRHEHSNHRSNGNSYGNRNHGGRHIQRQQQNNSNANTNYRGGRFNSSCNGGN